MNVSKALSAEDYKLLNSFEAIRKKLSDDKFADRLEKPLAYWVLPKDRRLPLAFLGRSVKELLATPFGELSATPGVGHKKINSLVRLLNRAVDEEPAATEFGDRSVGGVASEPRVPRNGKFDPATVSEPLWAQWRETIRRHNLGDEPLGRLAPTLQALPTVIWQTPLSFYLNYDLADIRRLKTYGEKRVRVVLEVFHVVHDVLKDVPEGGHLVIRLVPKAVPPMEAWINQVLQRPNLPDFEETRQNLALPLLNQIKIDAGDTVHELAEGRLGLQAAPQSVRTQSRQMGVTRARVYQMLEECIKLMNVRWPEGKLLLAQLAEKLATDSEGKQSLALCSAIRELLYPTKHNLLDDVAGNKVAGAKNTPRDRVQLAHAGSARD
jgi:hypothetical protein